MYDTIYMSACLELEKIASTPLFLQGRAGLKKRRKQLEADYYSVKPRVQAGAVGGAIGAMLATAGSSTPRLKKFKLPAAVVGGAMGAMIGSSMKQRSIINNLKMVDSRLKETKASNLKNL